MRNALLIIVAATLMTVPLAGTGIADQEAPEAQEVEVEVARTTADPGASVSSHIVHYNQQDCVDPAGIWGAQPPISHTSATFVPQAGTMVFSLDVFNLAPATCLPHDSSNLPPQNAYVGHYNFQLWDVGEEHDEGPPPSGPSLRFDCTYIGTPTLIFGNYVCSGPATFWADRTHEVRIDIQPSVDILGVPVPSVGAVELSVTQ